MRAKTIMPQTFKEFYDIAPQELKDYIDRSHDTAQTLQWHPEKWVYPHIKVVFNRAKKTGDINLMLAAFFHDLGKMDTTKKHPTISDKWSSPGHEIVSAKLVKKYADWIEQLGGDPNIVHFIVDQHMRIKQIDNMRPTKQQVLRQHEYFDLVHRFSEFDDMLKDYSMDLDD